MSTGNDSILDAYLYETNTLLEQLDSIVLASEEKDTFSEEDINTIFRIMHTIKEMCISDRRFVVCFIGTEMIFL